jgi:hypothetical protein
MSEVSKIDPADFEPAPRVVSKINSSDFEAKGGPPPKSLMDPHPETLGQQTMRIGKKIGALASSYDPNAPGGLAKDVKLAAGAVPVMASMFLPPGTGVATRVGTAFLGGLLSPYAEAGTAKALGEPAEMPTLYSALKVAGMNAAFEGLADTSPGAIKAAQDVSELPKGQQTFAQLTQQMRDKGFLEKLGMNEADIAEAMKNPEEAAAQLQKSIGQGNAVKDVFRKTTLAEGERLHGRFDAAYGDQITATGKVGDIGDSMSQVAAQAKASPGSMSPGFQNWLEKKGKMLNGQSVETAPAPGEVVRSAGEKSLTEAEPGMRAQIEAQRRGITDKHDLLEISNKARAAAKENAVAGPAGLGVEDIADLRSQMSRNLPANPTPMERKAAEAFNAQITSRWEETLRANHATEEQIGQLKGVYEEWGRFKQTVNGLRPGSQKFGEQTADAFFQTAKSNPTLALNFATMAEKAGKMPEFQEAWLKQLTQEMHGAAGGPINQMEIVQKLQTQWRSTEDGQAVLNAVWGKESPMSNPVELSKFLGSLNQKGTTDQLARAGKTVGNIGFTGRQMIAIGFLGGGIATVYQHPERLPYAIAALGTMVVAGNLMPRMSAGGQRAMIKMLSVPNPENVSTFLHVAGPALTAGVSQPKLPESSDLATETPKP